MQEEREAAFQRHLRSAADEAITGRPRDSENYNIGFLNVLDASYPEIAAAAREFHPVHRRRLGESTGAK